MGKKIKGKRGRPKGSKNRSTLLKEEIERRATTESTTTLIPPKLFKHLGFCRCGGMIGSLDIVSKSLYKCPQCGNSGKVKNLKKDKNSEKYTSKRDYLEHINSADFHDMPALSDELDPATVKVKE